VRALGQQQDLEGGGVLAAPLLIEAGDREDLVRAAEVEHLDAREDQDANALALHRAPRLSTDREASSFAAWPSGLWRARGGRKDKDAAFPATLLASRVSAPR